MLTFLRRWTRLGSARGTGALLQANAPRVPHHSTPPRRYRPIAPAVLMSVWRTCWQQGRSALDFVSQLLRGMPMALAPS